MTGYALTDEENRKFIPVLRRGKWAESAPDWLRGTWYIDLSGDRYSESEYEELLRTLHGAREEAPPVGPRPNFRDEETLQAGPAPLLVNPFVGSPTPQPRSSVTPRMTELREFLRRRDMARFGELFDTPQTTELREFLRSHFTDSEIRDICFDLRVDYEDLPGSSEAAKVRELINHLEHRERLPELLAVCQRERPMFFGFRARESNA